MNFELDFLEKRRTLKSHLVILEKKRSTTSTVLIGFLETTLEIWCVI
jgi:hypothetical protein